MKKMLLLAMGFASVVSGANAAPSYLQKTNSGAYNVTYDYQDKEKTGWYAAGRLGINFLSFTNKYDTNIPSASGAVVAVPDDEYSMEMVFSGNVAFGRKFGYFWRGELEAGYLSELSDKTSGSEFNLSSYYLMANAYYDFLNGFYLGAGAGIALLDTNENGSTYVDNSTGSASASPMLGLMAGFSKKLDDNIVLDLRYRLAGISGTDAEYQHTLSGQNYYTKTDIGLILENSLSVGLRYEF